MGNRTQRFQQQPQDSQLWQKLYYKHQQEYIRKKLKTIEFLWQGRSRTEVTRQVGCTYKTLTTWMEQYLEGGLSRLTQPISHQVESRLTMEYQLELKRMVLKQTPRDYGIDRPLWTAAILCEVIQQR